MSGHFILAPCPDELYFVNIDDISRVRLRDETAEIFFRSGGSITLVSQPGIEHLTKKLNSLIVVIEEREGEDK